MIHNDYIMYFYHLDHSFFDLYFLCYHQLNTSHMTIFLPYMSHDVLSTQQHY